MKAMAVFFAATVGLSGCATYPSSATAYVDCSGEKCEELWARAQAWLATNSRYRIQVVNENIIQTYGPSQGEVNSVAYSLTKTKNQDGSSRIHIYGLCNNGPYGSGCMHDPSPYTNLLFNELTKQ